MEDAKYNREQQPKSQVAKVASAVCACSLTLSVC